ncbi:MAG: acyl-CoA synthetase [Proteobacteria bacterium]|nr:acyl-CoA synthetase [Pseudomonadota bacterium]
MSLPLFNRVVEYADRTAIISAGIDYTYTDLLRDSKNTALLLLDGSKDLNEARVAFLFSSGYDYVRVQWAIWRAGGIAVPLCTTYPSAELEYFIADSRADIVVAEDALQEKVKPIATKMGLRYLSLSETASSNSTELADIRPGRRAMILYTSGTTGKPKGVVSSHQIIQAQIESLVKAWEWSSDDRIMQILPLHHIHGIINIACCALWSGALLDMLPKFDTDAVWQRLVDADLTLFMAVPTIYSRLAAAWDTAPAKTQHRWSNACKKLRLMISGSAALPVAMLERWEQISGHRLLERYGMTEIGMALSNPLHGERLAGHVGKPLPGVDVRLVDEDGNPLTEGTKEGEIQVRGPNVFMEYWQRPDETRQAFDSDWFKTGDVAEVTNNIYRILGRNSMDIIKTGGFKVSALEVEEVLRTHEVIRECAVVAVPDQEWGEIIAVAMVLEPDQKLDIDSLRNWGKTKLAPYKVPSRLLIVDTLPQNAMGKVIKPEIVKIFQADIDRGKIYSA